MKYTIKKFLKPITKPFQDVKKFDVASFEYGDYDNWVEAIILNLTVEKDGTWLRMDCSTANGQTYIAYSHIYNGKCNLDIIGVAKEAEKIKE